MMKSKKTVAKMLLVAFVFSLVLPASVFAADAKTAADLNGHWAQTTIQQWMDKGMIGGYEDGTFRPDQSITRAEFIKLVNKAIGADKAGVVNFTDVSADDWFYGELQLAMGAGYAGGFEDGTFRPNDTVTRAQAAAFIAKAKNLANDSAAAARFVDNGSIADWAKGAVGAAAKAGYIGGYQDGTFQPDKALTRAEAVSMLDRVLNDEAQASKDDKKPVAGGGSSSGSGSSSGGGGGGGGSSTDKDDINTAQISYDASEKALTVKKGAEGATITASQLNNNAAIKTLTIQDGIDTVTIEGITIAGTTTINGGGSHSVHFSSCALQGQVILNKAAVHVALEDNTVVSGTMAINQPASLSVDADSAVAEVQVKNDLTLKAGRLPAVEVLAEATVAAESAATIGTATVATTAPVTIDAPADKVIVAQASTNVALEKNVTTVEVNAATTVSVASGAEVTEVQAKAAVTVAGAGTVTKAAVETTAPVKIQAQTTTVDVNAAGAAVTVAADVANVNVKEAAAIAVEKGATIESIASTAVGSGTVQVTGAGNVNEIIATDTAAVTVDKSVSGDEEVTVEQAYAITTAVKNMQGAAVTDAVTTTLPAVAKAGKVTFTVTTKAGYELISVSGSPEVTGNYTFTMGNAEAAVTIIVAEQPQWQTVPSGLDKTTISQNKTAYTAALTGSTTAAIENGTGQLFAGVDNTNNKFAQCVIDLGGLAAETEYTITQTNAALNKAYPGDFAGGSKVKTYKGADVADGLAFLVWQGHGGAIQFEIKAGDAAVRTITITNNTTAQPVDVSAVITADNGLRVANNDTVSGNFTGTLDQTLFGTANAEADLGQIVVKFIGLKEGQDYTIKQTNHALSAAYPDEEKFAGNIKEASGYKKADLEEGLYVLVLQGDTNTITIELSETGGEAVKTVAIANATTATETPVVPPTIQVGELSGTVTAQADLIASDANGRITDNNFSIAGLPTMTVSLKKGTQDYEAVRIVGEIAEGSEDNIQLIAQSGDVYYDTMKAGWGISTGFPLQDAETTVYIVSSKAGTYTGTIKLVNVENGKNEDIAEKAITIVVETKEAVKDIAANEETDSAE